MSRTLQPCPLETKSRGKCLSFSTLTSSSSGRPAFSEASACPLRGRWGNSAKPWPHQPKFVGSDLRPTGLKSACFRGRSAYVGRLPGLWEYPESKALTESRMVWPTQDPAIRWWTGGRLIAAFPEGAGSLQLSELARRAGLPLTTAHRLVQQLAGHGLVEALRASSASSTQWFPPGTHGHTLPSLTRDGRASHC